MHDQEQKVILKDDDEQDTKKESSSFKTHGDVSLTSSALPTVFETQMSLSSTEAARFKTQATSQQRSEPFQSKTRTEDLGMVSWAQDTTVPNLTSPATNKSATQTNPVSDTEWDSYVHSRMPIAYSFLGTDDILRQRLSEQLTNSTRASQPTSDKWKDEENHISMWSSSKRMPSTTWSSMGPPTGDSSAQLSPGPKSSHSTIKSCYIPHSRSEMPPSENCLKSNCAPTKNNPMQKMDDVTRYCDSDSRPPIKTMSSSSSVLSNSDLGSGSQNNQFGPGVRAKLSTVLPELIETIPIGSTPTIFLTEYGCMHSRAVNLFKNIIECFVSRIMEKKRGDSTNQQNQRLELDRASRSGFAEETADTVNFMVIHEDSEQSDLRSFQQMLDSHPDSYLNPLWQSSHNPSLQNAIFSTFVMCPFGSRIVPPDSLHLGFSLMDLHWTHTPANNVSIASMAHAELTMSLNARAREFRRGGIYMMAFIARSEATTSDEMTHQPKSETHSENSSETSSAKHTVQSPAAISGQDATRFASAQPSGVEPGPKNIWATMSDMIVPCLQRLVSCGMMKVDVARHMLTLPMYQRTMTQTLRVLEKFNDIWSLDWSCGLGKSELTEIVTEKEKVVSLQSEPNPLRLPHPAWLALKAGKIPQTTYNDHVIHMFKNLYEGHFRLVLRERGQLSKGAVEFVLDSLWDVLRARLDEPDHCPLANCELEVQLLALRRL